MGPVQVVLLMLFALLLAAGQVGFKYAALHINAMQAAGKGLLSFISVPLILSLMLYAGATVLWIFVLTKVSLGRAYPFALFGAAIVPVASYVLFKEQFSATYPIGFLLVVAGIYLCVR